MTGIIGAGFGLYGYFPAVVKTEGKAVLLEEAKSIFEGRPELQKYKDNILWCDNIDTLLPIVDKLIVCVPPKIQESYFDKILQAANINSVIFEKPIASNPQLSLNILSRLSNSNKTFRIGYTFLYTNWFSTFNFNAVKNTNIEINWTFKAYHYKSNIENWKRYNSEGGGVIRFFGIHLFPLLISFGFNNVINSQTSGKNTDDLENWKAVFTNEKGCECTIDVDSNCEQEIFSIKTDNGQKELINFVSPFETANNSIQTEDNRVIILERLLSSLNNENQNKEMINLYNASNDLWMRAEKINRFITL
jgi:predicted dehydrogenase